MSWEGNERFVKGNKEFEPVRFESGDLVTVNSYSPEEFVEFIGTAFYDKAKKSLFSEHAADLIRRASKCLMGARFKVVFYDRAYKGEIDKAELILDYTSIKGMNLNDDPDIKALNEEFEASYNTDLFFFLKTERILVDASELKKVD